MGPRRRLRSTAGTQARAMSSPCRLRLTSTRPTACATALPALTSRSRSSRCGPPRARPASIDVTDLPTIERRGGVGPLALAEADCSIWIPASWRAEPGAAGALVLRRVGRDARSGRSAGPRVAPRRDRRRDGRRAAPFRLQPEHQGAGRLLGRRVHTQRRAARPGRAHPGPPRIDACVGRRRDRGLRRDHPRRRPRPRSTTRSRVAPTSTT